MEHIRKIVKSFRKFGLLIKDVTERIENETKEKRSRILGMLISTLGGGLLRQMLVGKGTIVTRQEQGIFKTGDGMQKYFLDIHNFRCLFTKQLNGICEEWDIQSKF